jgi:hypothetical protein
MMEIDDVPFGQLFDWWMQVRNQLCTQVCIQVNDQVQAHLGIQVLDITGNLIFEEVQDQHHGN